MASIIDSTYFHSDINVPSSAYSTLDEFITKHEPIILTKLLGYTLYKLVLNDPASPVRIGRLVDGFEYTIGSGDSLRYVKFEGLRDTVAKISLIANYVYYYYLRDKMSVTTSAGEIAPRFENSAVAAMQLKMSSAWQKLRELYGFRGQGELEPSVLNYLLEHESDYPEWDFKHIGTVTTFDL